MNSPSTIAEFRAAFEARRPGPGALAAALGGRPEPNDDHRVWIRRLESRQIRAHIERLVEVDKTSVPLRGVPFAIKDNIDLAGVPTTAGCPDYAYTPVRSATVVERLVAAGAIPMGKTNMDQFATGLVGTRSPYGAVVNALQPDHVSGGSSSGSAVAVKLGLVAFALGTDTAGSGRVPAAFNELVGFKPTRGWWSTRGVVPACRTLDCVSVFTQTVGDARTVARVAGGFDEADPYARRIALQDFDEEAARIGFFDPHELPHVDEGYRACYADFVDRLPGEPIRIDHAPFLEAAALLYDGPWLAERYAAIGCFLEQHPEAFHPVTRRVIAAGNSLSAVACFRAQYRLAMLKREVERAFRRVDVLALPTVPRIYTRGEVEADPFGTNARLGTFTNFVNLLDLCAVAVPAGRCSAGLPFGVTLTSPAGFDFALLDAAARLLGEVGRGTQDGQGTGP
ncbi:MAG: allophanate hydrolase [Gammaproteobacteria bacterium]|nr:allophanate hydrolase [Gammaproteobacteria bacterium]